MSDNGGQTSEVGHEQMRRESVVLRSGESRRTGHVILKVTGEDTLGAYALRENIAPPGFMVNPHRHRDTDEAWFVVIGELTFLGGSSVHRVAAGGFIFVPRGQTHAFTNRGNRDAHYLVILSPPGLENMFEEILALRAAGQSSQERVAEIRARYYMDEVAVEPSVWPPSD